VLRRTLLLGLGAAAMPSFAFADTHVQLPGGGSAVIPSPYDRKPSYPTYADRTSGNAHIGYRNWRSTMSGYPECDGMLAVGRNEKFQDLRDFVGSCRAGLSVQWSDADRIPGQPWDGNEKRWQMELADSAEGGILTQKLAVHRVGFSASMTNRRSFLRCVITLASASRSGSTKNTVEPQARARRRFA
jgi:hypothetical protein